jgi:hypothetical protein
MKKLGTFALVALIALSALVGWYGPKSKGTQSRFFLIRAADAETTFAIGRTHVSVTQVSSTSPCKIRPIGSAFTAGQDTVIFAASWEWAGDEIDSIHVISLSDSMCIEASN